MTVSPNNNGGGGGGGGASGRRLWWAPATLLLLITVMQVGQQCSVRGQFLTSSQIYKNLLKEFTGARGIYPRELRNSRTNARLVITRARSSIELGPWARAALELDGSGGVRPVDYQVGCILPRGNTIKYSPVMYFYSKQTHTNETRGCEVVTKLVLNTTPKRVGGKPKLVVSDGLISELTVAGYNGRLPTYILTHGFLSSWNAKDWMCRIKDLILDHSRANVFILDWSGGSRPSLPLDYTASVANTKHVGGLVAAFVRLLLQLFDQRDASNFHLIGHSLGAHILGYVGYSLNNLGRITALDPAGPCFSTHNDKQRLIARKTGRLPNNRRRLSPASAKLVVALHTDSSLFGLNENCGHYDVYINGGYTQPHCVAASFAKRLHDLMSMKLKEFLNTEICCAHSYVCNLLDRFVSYFQSHEIAPTIGSDGGGGGGGDDDKSSTSLATSNSHENQNLKCYPVAYKCDDWNSFMSGECGFCLDDDTNCVYIGLGAKYSPRKPIGSRDRSTIDSDTLVKLQSFNYVHQDDSDFNDENKQQQQQQRQPGGENADSDTRESKELGGDGETELHKTPNVISSIGHHFIRTDAGSLTCTYHYQIVVATRRSLLVGSNEQRDKIFYYLNIPLESSGSLGNEHQNHRLVQVSHRVEQNSSAHRALARRYVPNAIERVIKGSGQLATKDLQFHTALITFSQAPSSQCTPSEANQTDGLAMNEKWQLCKPLDSIREARLWSFSGEKLEAVEWVALNYMSGLTYEQRASNSYVFAREIARETMRREQVEGFDRILIDFLESGTTIKTQANTVGTIKQKLGCFLSFMDRSADGRARARYNCGKSGRKLDFAINLTPVNF